MIYFCTSYLYCFLLSVFYNLTANVNNLCVDLHHGQGQALVLSGNLLYVIHHQNNHISVVLVDCREKSRKSGLKFRC